MTKHRIAFLAAAALLAGTSFSMADEVTKTTSTTVKSDPTVVVTPPPVVEQSDAGCSKKTVTKTDGDTGDTTKKTTSDCD